MLQKPHSTPSPAAPIHPELDKILFAYQQWVGDGFGPDLRLPGARLTHDEAKSALQALIDQRSNEARREQDMHSRGDEFLWLVRKLKEYMSRSDDPYYTTFLENVIEIPEAKYRAYFAEKDRIKPTTPSNPKEPK